MVFNRDEKQDCNDEKRNGNRKQQRSEKTIR